MLWKKTPDKIFISFNSRLKNSGGKHQGRFQVRTANSEFLVINHLNKEH